MNRNAHPLVRTALLLLGILLLAGCFGATVPEDSGYVDVTNPMPEGHAHDHRDPDAHRFAKGARVLAHHPVADVAPDGWLGAYAFVDHDASKRAVVATRGETSALYVFDMSDVTQPVLLGSYQPKFALRGERNIAFSGDGQLLFVGVKAHPDDPPQINAGQQPGIAVFDLSDPTNIQEREDLRWIDPAMRGPRTMAARVFDGNQFVYARTVGVTIFELENTPTGQQFMVRSHVLDPTGIVDPNDPFAAVVPAAQDPQTAVERISGHDMRAFRFDRNQRIYLAVALGFEGARILDITNPSVPVQIARWNPNVDSNADPYFIQTAAIFDNPDGRAIFVAGAESFNGSHENDPGILWVFDVTRTLGTGGPTTEIVPESSWSNPGNTPAGNLLMSLNAIRVGGGFIYATHYHGGVWVLDVLEPRQTANPEVVAYILPVPENARMPPKACCTFDLAATPMMVDIGLMQGKLMVLDFFQGLFVIEVDAVEARREPF